MKVSMLETYQGVGQTATLVHEEDIRVAVLEKGMSYNVDVTLGTWLIENNKAVPYEKVVEAYYGSQPEPELRNDEQAYEEQAAASAEEENIMTTPTVKKTRKGKGG